MKTTKPVSDEKALALKGVSDSVKRLAGLRLAELPAGSLLNWTIYFEEALSRFSCKDLDSLQFFFEVLRAGVATGDLPK